MSAAICWLNRSRKQRNDELAHVAGIVRFEVHPKRDKDRGGNQHADVMPQVGFVFGGVAHPRDYDVFRGGVESGA